MLKDLILKSRSTRRFDADFIIPKEDILELVDLARLGPSAANRQPLKFFISYAKPKNDLIFPCLRWAAALKEWGGPSENERPSAYILILGDTTISDNVRWDDAIAAQNIMLGATEKGLGSCIFASIDRDSLQKYLCLPERYKILLAVAVGKPAEKVSIVDIPKDGNTNYYRDHNNVHCVPKRSLDDVVLE